MAACSTCSSSVLSGPWCAQLPLKLAVRARVSSNLSSAVTVDGPTPLMYLMAVLDRGNAEAAAAAAVAAAEAAAEAAAAGGATKEEVEEEVEAVLNVGAVGSGVGAAAAATEALLVAVWFMLLCCHRPAPLAPKD